MRETKNILCLLLRFVSLLMSTHARARARARARDHARHGDHGAWRERSRMDIRTATRTRFHTTPIPTRTPSPWMMMTTLTADGLHQDIHGPCIQSRRFGSTYPGSKSRG